MEIAHYEAMLIEKHREYVRVNYLQKLSHTGSVLHDATTRLIMVLEYFSQKSKVQNLPLSMYTFTCYLSWKSAEPLAD